MKIVKAVIVSLSLICLLLAAPSIALAGDSYCNPLDVLIADPFVLQHDGIYYLYGTSRARDGFEVWSGNDLVHWRAHGFAYKAAPDDWARSGFWASECFEHKGKFYLHGGALTAGRGQHRIILCRSDSPIGPFKVLKAPWLDLGKAMIDSDVFRDNDGSLYLYYVREWPDNDGRSEIFVRKLNDDLLTFDGPPTSCIRPSQFWEGPTINEGPFVIRHGDVYYLMYSGDTTFGPGYAVGYATSNSPLGPWTKFEDNPILKKTATVSGPGHHSVVPSPDGKELFIVYHTHQQPTKPTYARQLAIDRLTFENDGVGRPMKLVVKGPTDTPQPMPSGSPEIVRGRSDELNTAKLDRANWTIFNERPDHWNLEDGSLVIHTQDGETAEMRSDLKNLFLTDPPAGDFAVTTHVKFHPEQDLEQAFICLWQNHNDFVRLSLAHDGDQRFEIATEHQAKFQVKTFPNNLGNDVQLQIQKHGDALAFRVSADGKKWTTLADNVVIKLQIPRVGLGASAPESRRDIPAAFDFIHFDNLESAPRPR